MLLVGNVLDHIRQHERAHRQAVVFRTRNVQPLFVCRRVAAYDVFRGDGQPVRRPAPEESAFGRWPTPCSPAPASRSGTGGNRNHFLDRADHLPASQRLDLGVDIYRGFRHSILLLILQILALKLNGQVGKHGGAGDREVIRPHLHRQQVVFDGRLDQSFQILELHGRRLLQVGVLLQPRELVHLRRQGLASRFPAAFRRCGVKRSDLSAKPSCSYIVRPAPGTRDKRVFLGRVHGDVILVGHGRIDKFNGHVRTAAFEIPVAPSLIGEERGLAAAFLDIALAGAARSMGIILVRRAELDIDLPAVGFPAGNARSETVIGPRDAAIVLFLELVFFGVRGRIAAQPELLDERLLFVVGGEAA